MTIQKVIQPYIFKILVGFFLTFPIVSFGATGTIDPANSTSVLLQDSSNLNWYTANGDPVVVADSALTGDIYGATLGWINLDPAFGGVTNTCDGELGGYAYGSTAGWVNFGPFLNSATQEVIIDTVTGEFDGYAWSQNYGWIEFDCAVLGECVATTWSGCTSNGGGDGGGGNDAQCEDGKDNDGDGNVDFPADPGCDSVSDDTESNIMPSNMYACNDGKDNDSDGKVDFTEDPGCAGPYDNNETDIVIVVDDPIEESDPTCEEIGNCAEEPCVGDECDEGPGDVGPGDPSDDPDDVCVGSECDPGINDPTTPAGGVKEVIEELPNGIIGSVGLAGGVIASIIPLLLGLSRLLGSAGSAGSLLTSFFGIRKKKAPWGTVYDSVTKQPLDPAYVVLYNAEKQQIGDSISDMDGRYGFLVTPGSYSLIANKTHYLFPSIKLAGKSKDELYQDLYFGESFEIKSKDDIVSKNIPMDPLEFDWNEFEKSKHHLTDFYKRSDVILTRILNTLFVVGCVMSVISFIVDPDRLVNQIILGLYVVVAILKSTVFKWRAFGVISEKASKEILSFAIVRIFSQAGNEIAHRVTDEWGRYYMLVRKGVYTVTVEKKLTDGTYQKVHSETIKAKHGIINKAFKV